MKIVVVTGLSGAGKSVALKTLEDMGYEAVDNIPLSIIPALLAGETGNRRLAIGADVRSRDFSVEQFIQVMQEIRARPDISTSLIYLDCDDEVLRRRFSETRRRHPMAQDRAVTDGISYERRLIEKLNDYADVVIDTSDYGIADLRQSLKTHYSEESKELSLFITSFSFRKGVPRDADLVFDVRFLENPHYVEALRPLDGRNKSIAEYIATDKDFAPFYDNLCNLIVPLLPRYRQEGKSYLTVAFGCTGGRHRSVFLAEKLAGFLSGKGYKVGLRHRDLEV